MNDYSYHNVCSIINAFQKSVNFPFNKCDRSKAVLLLWIVLLVMLMLVYVVLSCLFLVALWSPAGKGLTSWLSCLLHFITFPNVSWSTSELRESWHCETGLSPPVKYFTDRSKAVLLLWIVYVFSVLCLLCLCARLLISALWSPAGKGLTFWLSFVVSNCESVSFPLVS